MKHIIRIILMISIACVSCESDSHSPVDLEKGMIGYGRKSSSDPMLYKTTNGGETWKTTNTSFRFVSFPSDEIGYGRKSSSDPGLYKTTNGGETWRKVTNTSFKFIDFPRN